MPTFYMNFLYRFGMHFCQHRVFRSNLSLPCSVLTFFIDRHGNRKSAIPVREFLSEFIYFLRHQQLRNQHLLHRHL